MHAVSTTATIQDPTWRRLWLEITLAGAVAVTLFDAALLQQKKAFFTGGFLAGAYTSTIWEAAAFVAVSLLADAAVVGLAAAVAIRLTAGIWLTPAARRLAAAAAGLAPLVIADFLNYELMAYLGDAFDLGLMFDLTGRKPAEILAVASAQLASPAMLTVGAACLTASVVWVVNRFGPGARRTGPASSRRSTLDVAALCAGALMVVSVASAASDTLEDGLRRKPSSRALGLAAQRLTDVDRDGFGLVGRTRDPNLFDAGVFPYGVDLPGNHIDEDGLLGDLASADPQYAEPASRLEPWPSRPNLVLFVLESFRADALGRRVGGTEVTPVLNGLATRGISASMAYSHNGYTAQSRFHLMTGSLAGIRRGGSLVDDFKAQGYDTAYFSAQDESFGGPALGVGFDRAEVAYDARQDRKLRYTSFSTAGSLAVSHATLTQRIGEYLSQRTSKRPLFLYVNFHDTHYPYAHEGIAPLLPHERLAERAIGPANAGRLQGMYFNTAANVDAAVGRTFEILTRALGGPPAVIVTADHGESLFDEGFLGHGYALNDVQTRIPLIAAGLPLEIVQPFAQVDLRNAIHAALAAGASSAVAPRLRTAGDKRIFQYLGNIDRPRQIGFADGAGRIVYDFRTGRVRLPDLTWHRLSDLTGSGAAAARELIEYWERMMVARARLDAQ